MTDKIQAYMFSVPKMYQAIITVNAFQRNWSNRVHSSNPIGSRYSPEEYIDYFWYFTPSWIHYGMISSLVLCVYVHTRMHVCACAHYSRLLCTYDIQYIYCLWYNDLLKVFISNTVAKYVLHAKLGCIIFMCKVFKDGCFLRFVFHPKAWNKRSFQTLFFYFIFLCTTYLWQPNHEILTQQVRLKSNIHNTQKI